MTTQVVITTVFSDKVSCRLYSSHRKIQHQKCSNLSMYHNVGGNDVCSSVRKLEVQTPYTLWVWDICMELSRLIDYQDFLRNATAAYFYRNPPQRCSWSPTSPDLRPSLQLLKVNRADKRHEGLGSCNRCTSALDRRQGVIDFIPY